MLRRVLITFGWIIPLVSVFTLVIDIALTVQKQPFVMQNQAEFWMTITRSFANGIQNITLSPLCFFGAHMLKKPGGVSE